MEANATGTKHEDSIEVLSTVKYTLLQSPVMKTKTVDEKMVVVESKNYAPKPAEANSPPRHDVQWP